MFSKNNHSPIKYMFSKQLNLSDFGFEKKTENYIKKFQKTNNNDINQNKLIKILLNILLTMRIYAYPSIQAILVIIYTLNQYYSQYWQ